MQIDLFYNGVATFCLPKSQLDSSIQFFLMFRDKDRKEILNLVAGSLDAKVAGDSPGNLHMMPNVLAGDTQIVDNQLSKIFFSNDGTKQEAVVTYLKKSPVFPLVADSSTRLLFGCYPLSPDKLKLLEKSSQSLVEGSRVSKQSKKDSMETQHYANLLKENLEGLKLITDEKTRWQLLSKELSQKQELIHRLLREYDEKTENLSVVGDEIVELRREMKLTQNENSMLRRRLEHEEKLEIHKVVSKEIQGMGGQELRVKLVKIAQAYRDERSRNVEFEKALKMAHRDLKSVQATQKEYDDLQRVHESKSKKLLEMQSELRKISLFRDTIKK